MSSAVHDRAWNVETRSLESADGVVLAADFCGDPAAATVVLAHGGGQTRHSWAGAMRGLARRGYRVIAYDARGHGDSGWAPNGAYSTEAHAQDMRRVLDEAHGPRAVIGASMGAATGLYAVTHGLALDAFVMVDFVPTPEPRGVERIMNFMTGHPDGFATLEEAAAAVSAYNPHRKAPASPEGLRKNLRQRDDGRFYWHWDPAMISRERAAQIGELADLIRGAAWRDQIPTLLVRGMQSDILSDANVAAFQALVPKVEVVNVGEAGHMIAGDQNDVFVEVTFDFLQRHLPPRR